MSEFIIERKSGCYLLQREVDAQLKNDKYKIGKSTNIKQRLHSTEYRNATVIAIAYMEDIGKCENQLISTFNERFNNIHKSTSGSFGKETFAGDKDEMIKTFNDVCIAYTHTDEINSVKLTNTQAIPTITVQKFDVDSALLLYNKCICSFELYKILYTSNGESIVEFTYNGISIKKHSDLDMFNLGSVEQSLQCILHRPNLRIQQFLKSLSFYNQLCIIDSSLQKYGNVYLIINTDVNTFTIGRGYVYDLNHIEKEKTGFIKVIAVGDEASVESELLSEYEKSFSYASSTKEAFTYTTKKQVIDIFDSITLPKQVEIDYKSSNAINNYGTLMNTMVYGQVKRFVR